MRLQFDEIPFEFSNGWCLRKQSHRGFDDALIGWLLFHVAMHRQPAASRFLVLVIDSSFSFLSVVDAVVMSHPFSSLNKELT